MVQRSSNQKAGATSHQPHSGDIATINVTMNDMSAQRTQPASAFGKGGVEILIIKLPNHYKLKCAFTRKRTWYMYVLHMSMPERLRECQYGWSKSTNMKTFKCDRFV